MPKKKKRRSTSPSEGDKSDSEEDEQRDEEYKEEETAGVDEDALKTEALYHYYSLFTEKRVKNLPWRLKYKDSEQEHRKLLFRRERPPWFENEDPEVVQSNKEFKEELKEQLGLPPYPPRIDKLKKLTEMYNECLLVTENLPCSAKDKHYLLCTPKDKEEEEEEGELESKPSSQSSILPPYEYDDEFIEEETVKEQKASRNYFGEEAVREEAMKEEAVKEEAVKEEAAMEEAVREEAVREEETLREEHAGEEAVKELLEEELGQEKVEEEEVLDETCDPNVHPALRPLMDRNPDKATYTVVFLRSADTVLDEKNIVTGWIQAQVSAEGRKAITAACAKLSTVPISVVFLSSLRSSFITLKAIEKLKAPARFKIIRTWQLNDRHMGELTGCSIRSLKVRYGELQTKVWLDGVESYTPALTVKNENYFQVLEDSSFESEETEPIDVPKSETVAQAMERSYNYWKMKIVPEIKKGEAVLVITHDVNIRGILQRLLVFPVERAAQMRFLHLPLRVEMNARCGTAKSWEYLADDDLIEEFGNNEFEKDQP